MTTAHPVRMELKKSYLLAHLPHSLILSTLISETQNVCEIHRKWTTRIYIHVEPFLGFMLKYFEATNGGAIYFRAIWTRLAYANVHDSWGSL